MSNEGYLVGGYSQQYRSLESSGVPRVENQWGLVADQQLLGQSRVFLSSEGWDSRDGVRYSWLFFTDQRDAVGALKIVGGRQLFWEGSNGRETFVWGNRAPYEQEVYISYAYDNNVSSWQSASIRLYVVVANDNQLPGFRIVGARQLARDLESKHPYITINEWGDTSAQEQFIGIGEAWSQNYSWGFSQISLFLATDEISQMR